ncbi:hypothetical protein, partial [Limosilactobacillus fermentum]|uniref:hypothetical protein n=1 Tax=Limosilactobacillus fermentum TaxID=1613 RepID=UPI0021C14AF0
KPVHGESLLILIGFLAISIIRGRLSLFQYPQGINLHKIFYTPNMSSLFYRYIIKSSSSQYKLVERNNLYGRKEITL